MSHSCHCKRVGELSLHLYHLIHRPCFVVHVWFLLTPERLTPHGVPLEDRRQPSPMFRPPGGRHCSRYVGESRTPLPSTPRSHLAASALSLRLVIVQRLCVGAFATDQRSHLLEKARAWRASSRVGPCRMLPPQRVGVRLSLLINQSINQSIFI